MTETAEGECAQNFGELRLIGRPTTSVADSIATAPGAVTLERSVAGNRR